MTAYAAIDNQRNGRKGWQSLTPPGWSHESIQLQGARRVSLEEYYALPASRHRQSASEDQNFELQAATEDLHNLLLVHLDLLPRDVGQGIARRIDALTDPDNWDSEDQLPNAESFRRLLVFLADHHELRKPSIFLNRYGLFTASWRPDRRHLASLVFHADNNVNWLVFTPRSDDEIDVVEAAGRAPIEIVAEEVGKHGALVWMCRP